MGFLVLYPIFKKIQSIVNFIPQRSEFVKAIYNILILITDLEKFEKSFIIVK
jgi:hypothetical protein